MSPSDASGERGPPAPSTSPTSAPSGHASLRDEIGDRERGPAEGVGGHRRCHRDLVRAVRRAHHVRVVAGRGGEHVGVGRAVAGRERLHRLARRDDEPAAARARTRARAATHVLPTSVPVPVTTTSRRGRGAAAAAIRRRRSDLECGERGDERVDLLVGVRGGQRHPQPGGAGRDGRRPDRGHEHPLLEQRRGRRERGALVAEHDGHDRRRMCRAAGGRRARAAGARSCVALGRPEHRERGERGGGVGRASTRS